MACSMTGFGQASGEVAGETVVIEVSAVNHRFLDPTFRLPFAWAAIEPELREAVKRQVGRGKVNVVVRRDRSASARGKVRCDFAVAQQYVDAGKELSRMMSSTQSLSLDTLARLEGVFTQEEDTQDPQQIGGPLVEILERALAQFNAVRNAEGQALTHDMLERIAQMVEALDVVEARIPELGQQYEDRLRARVAELLEDKTLAEDRISLEVAMLAEKADVNEEAVRLKAHFEQAVQLLNSPEPTGRELGFLSQEIQREVNTLGSKLRDVGVTREVLRMKSELEKLKEQAQNIE
jgi:uncharacterized protein (TIGR00255 family)